jgi:hypothetical protein
MFGMNGGQGLNPMHSFTNFGTGGGGLNSMAASSFYSQAPSPFGQQSYFGGGGQIMHQQQQRHPMDMAGYGSYTMNFNRSPLQGMHP